MRQGTCCACGLTASIRSFYSFNGKNYCEPCVWRASREARERGETGEYVSLTDNSICARCGAYSGDAADHQLIGQLPLCQGCASNVNNWPYPRWLKLTFAALLLLLVVALAHGRKYFHAGRTMYIGQRLVEEKRHREALPYLQETLRIAPESDKAVLLTAKAALKIGDVDLAAHALQGHDGGKFEDDTDDDFIEVKQLWTRASDALQKADEAVKLVKEGHGDEAGRLMHEAAELYPEAVGLVISAQLADANAAFDRKDYDSFLVATQHLWNEHPSSLAAAELASALACKYAETGDAAYRAKSEAMLQLAQQEAQKDPQSMKEFQEYSERIRYRLTSREIIDTPEYNRRFRGGPKKE